MCIYMCTYMCIYEINIKSMAWRLWMAILKRTPAKWFWAWFSRTCGLLCCCYRVLFGSQRPLVNAQRWAAYAQNHVPQGKASWRHLTNITNQRFVAVFTETSSRTDGTGTQQWMTMTPPIGHSLCVRHCSKHFSDLNSFSLPCMPLKHS